MKSFEEYVSEINDPEFLYYLERYNEFGEQTKYFHKDHNDIFSAFKVVHVAGTLEARLDDEYGIPLDPDEREYEIEFDPMVYEIFTQSKIDEMVETTYEAGWFINNLNGNSNQEHYVVGKLLGSFLLGLGYDGENYVVIHMKEKMGLLPFYLLN